MKKLKKTTAISLAAALCASIPTAVPALANGEDPFRFDSVADVTLDLCQYFEHKKLKGYADFFNSSSSFCCGVI